MSFVRFPRSFSHQEGFSDPYFGRIDPQPCLGPIFLKDPIDILGLLKLPKSQAVQEVLLLGRVDGEPLRIGTALLPLLGSCKGSRPGDEGVIGLPRNGNDARRHHRRGGGGGGGGGGGWGGGVG